MLPKNGYPILENGMFIFLARGCTVRALGTLVCRELSSQVESVIGRTVVVPSKAKKERLELYGRSRRQEDESICLHLQNIQNEEVSSVEDKNKQSFLGGLTLLKADNEDFDTVLAAIQSSKCGGCDVVLVLERPSA